MKTGKCTQPWIILVKLVSLTTTRLGRRHHPFRKPVLQSPQGDQATVTITGLNHHHRYRIFGGTTAVAIITFQSVCSGSDDTELFFHHHLGVERDLLLEDQPHSKLWLALEHLPSDGMCILFLNWEFPAAPLWQQCPWGLLEGRGKAELGRWRKFTPGRWCQSKPEDAFRWSKPCVFMAGVRCWWLLAALW